MKYLILSAILILSIQDKKDLYVMYYPDQGLYKIGQSNNCDRRLKEIDYVVNCKTDMDVILVRVYNGMGSMEKAMHVIFKSRKVSMKYCKKNSIGKGIKSREWFMLDESDIEDIDCIMN